MTFAENIKRICLERGTNMTAIEQGMITSTTKERLEELELEKNDVDGQIAREEMKKPLLTKERIMYWLVSSKSGVRK